MREEKISFCRKKEIIREEVLLNWEAVVIYLIFIMLFLAGGCQFGLENDRFHFYDAIKKQHEDENREKIEMHFGPTPEAQQKVNS